ncbi:hypothetical protein SS50377_24834 [Spironucleus salmonicida]|uniref:Uncharacterized protein n=1 Tax=Spironucleus salmonicida TaxID=348837 RepID=V6LQG6_9EUKA|nr:hypothetical protein SS50377_24834 [Spironucleus salmonicida]|eukprot:EST46825.1 Hypothetical protein SS50377_13155 [Spironucleus salmonicida]
MQKCPTSPLQNNKFFLIIQQRKSPDYVPQKRILTLPPIQIVAPPKIYKLPIVLTSRNTESAALKPILSKMYQSVAAAKKQKPFPDLLKSVTEFFERLKANQFDFNLEVFNTISFQEERTAGSNILKDKKSYNELHAQKRLLIVILGEYAEDFFQYIQKMKWQHGAEDIQVIKVNEVNYISSVLDVINIIISKAKTRVFKKVRQK